MPARRFIRMRCIQTNNQKTINHRKYLNAKYLKNMPMSKFIIYICVEHLWLSSSMLPSMFPCRPDVLDSGKLCLVKSKRCNDTLKSWKVPPRGNLWILWYSNQSTLHYENTSIKVSSSKIDLFNSLLSYLTVSYPWIMNLNWLYFRKSKIKHL